MLLYLSISQCSQGVCLPLGLEGVPLGLGSVPLGLGVCLWVQWGVPLGPMGRL